MPRERTWSNSDGLVVGFGTHTEDNRVPGVTAEKGTPYKVAKAFLVATTLEDVGSVTAASFYPQSIRLKRGSRITRAHFQVHEVFVSAGGGTLTIGTYRAQTPGTVDDQDGIDATIAVAAINAIGEIVVCDGALVNGTVPVGATSDSDVEIVFTRATAAFTAGTGTLTVEYVEPNDGADGLAA